MQCAAHGDRKDDDLVGNDGTARVEDLLGSGDGIASTKNTRAYRDECYGKCAYADDYS